MSKALIIDDNEQILEVLSFFFDANNAEYVTANNGKEGLNILRESVKDPKGDFGLVLLDLAMPELSGFQLLDILKKENLIRSKTFVILSALELNPEQVQSLMSNGVKSIIRKPINIKDIEGVLSKFI